MENKDFLKLKRREDIVEDVSHIGKKLLDLSADVIRLSVSQDAKYRDAREQLKQMEAVLERQQQKMVELQLQNETLSAQYQEELRQRSEVLKRVEMTREMSAMCEASSDCLKQTLLRCEAEKATICEIISEVIRNAQEQEQEQKRIEENYRQNLSSFQEKAKANEEHHNHMMERVKQVSQATIDKTEAELNDIKVRLANVTSQLAKQIQHEEKAKLKIISEFNNQLETDKSALQNTKKSLKEVTEANIELKKALNNQEVIIKSLLEQKNTLLECEKISGSVRSEMLTKNLKVEQVMTIAKERVNKMDQLEVSLKVPEKSSVIAPSPKFTKQIQLRPRTKKQPRREFDLPIEDDNNQNIHKLSDTLRAIQYSVRPSEYKRRRFLPPPEKAPNEPAAANKPNKYFKSKQPRINNQSHKK